MAALKLNHILKGVIYLDILNLEQKLSHVDNNIYENDCFVDLSQVRFIELTAITKLTLIIERLFKDGKNIYVALPTIRLTAGEAKTRTVPEREIINSLLHSRRKANNFLKTVGFITAIRDVCERYNKLLYITEDYDFKSEINLDSFFDSFSVVFEPQESDFLTYKYVLPLMWIDCLDEGNKFSAIERRVEEILDNPERGLESIDVQSIKNIIIPELIKNVKEHSGNRYALFTIGLINTSSLTRETELRQPDPLEWPYIKWLKEDQVSSQIEIYFGDSGSGVLTKNFRQKFLEEEANDIESHADTNSRQLKWAFKRWSTSKDNELRRGTKGLYRIQRIVNKYNGIIQITSDNHSGSFRKGGLKEEFWDYHKKSRNGRFRGTFIQIKLCPYREVTEFRFNLKDNSEFKEWRSVRYDGDDSQLLEKFKKDARTSDNLLVILDIQQFPFEKSKPILEHVLPEFSYYANPCAIVVFILSDPILISNTDIQTLVESTNERIVHQVGDKVLYDAVDKDDEIVYDPVLVIGNNNQAFWYGGSQELIKILDESYERYNVDLAIDKLKTFNSLEANIQSRIRLHLDSDNKLVSTNEKGAISFNFKNLDTYFERKLEYLISHENDGKQYCSPKLEVVDDWIPVKTLIENNEFGYALILYLKFKEQLIDIADKDNCFIIIDHSQQKELAKAFASLLGVKAKNIKNAVEDINSDVPRRSKLFRENSSVIVLTTIISSSETVRRLVKYALRDSAEPLIVLTLCNYRTHNITELLTWERVTKIIAVFTRHASKEEKREKDDSYFKEKVEKLSIPDLGIIDPDFRNVSTEVSNSNLIDENLKSFIIKNKCLHYHHIGIYKDRHFTFYLDKHKLVNIDGSIWNRIKDTVKEWSSSNLVGDFVIYVPKSLMPRKFAESPFYTFLKTLTPNVFMDDQGLEFINQENVLYLDFGMLTGKSVNGVVKKCKNVRNLFVCILFNQSLNGDLNFYQKIKKFYGSDSSNDGVQLIFGQSAETNFKIETLFDLSLGYFHSENCPICQHVGALESYKLNQSYMFGFSEDRQLKLKLKEVDDFSLANTPVDFYWRAEEPDDNELPSELIMKMYELKLLLEKAEYHTSFRIKVFQFVFNIYSNQETYLCDANSNLYAMLYYLSHEINWLQKEPLVFRDCRMLIAKIAFNISILSREVLEEKLLLSNNAKVSIKRIVVRYKYAAISVLRSANKQLFCNSISAIIKSSIDENHFSDNLVQNTLYHITSIFKNKYNKSISYYDNISLQLKIIEDNHTVRDSFSVPQKLAFQKIWFLNEKTKKLLRTELNRSDKGVIINLKHELEEIYSEHHPKPIEFFSAIDLNRYRYILEEYEIHKEKAEDFELIKPNLESLSMFWANVNKFINNVIIFYLEQLEEINQSQFFRRGFSNFIDHNDLVKDIEKFSELVFEIEKDLNSYSLLKEKFSHLYNKIYDLCIKAKNQKGSEENSKILDLISNFPSHITSILDLAFPTSVFHKRRINGPANLSVFYPQSELSINLVLVKSNIVGKINPGIDLKDVELIIDIEEIEGGKIELTIKYDSTEMYDKEVSTTGSLSSWEKDLLLFGGKLEYKIPDDGNKYFLLKLIFMNYENSF
jgi:hypothetical protein